VTVPRFTIVLLMMAFARAGSGQPPADHPVARVGKRVIVYREIACELNAPNFREVAEKQRRDPAEVCLEREQQRLQLLAATELVDAAVRKLDIEPTAEEMAADAAFHRYNEAEFTRLSEHYRAIGRAVLLVRRGQDAHTVYEQEVRAGGLTEAQFRRFVDLLPTADAAEQFIARHTPEHFRTSILTDARRRLARNRLMQHLTDEAKRRGVSFDAQAETFWRQLAAEVGLEILDPNYKPISLKELSWKPETSNMQ